MTALDIVFDEAEGGLVELLLRVAGEQGAAHALKALNRDDDQAAVLLRQLEHLQLIGDLQLQIIELVDPLQQLLLLRLGRDHHAILGKQVLQIVGRDVFPGNRSFADSGEHGIGQVKTDINFISCFGITHANASFSICALG